MKENTATSTSARLANEVGYYDRIEDRRRFSIRATIEAVFEEELEQFFRPLQLWAQRRQSQLPPRAL